MRRLVASAVSVLTIVLAGCSDQQPLISAPDNPEYYYGWDYGDTESDIHVHFDPLWGPIPRLWGAGLEIRTSTMGIGLADQWDPLMARFYPPTSGESALIPGVPSETGVAELLFDFPVKDISFNVRPWDNVTIQCFNEDGVAVAGHTVPGEYTRDGRWIHPSGFQPPIPIPLHEVKLSGKGVRRCTLRGMGGMIDDLRYSRDRNNLELTCDPARVTRGAEVTCTAELTGTGSEDWKPSSWKFIAPTEGVEIPRLDNVEERTWRGKMVLTGTVIVTAQIGGRELADSFAVVVENRVWQDRAPAYTFRQIANGADARLVLPPVVRFSEHLGVANWFQTETPTSYPADHTDQVVGGPNDELKFFNDETTIYFYGYYTVNTTAMTQGSNFYKAQERAGDSGGIGGMNWCSASVVTSSLPALVERHEVYHGEVYERVLRLQFPDALVRLERIVAPDLDKLYDAYELEWNSLDDAARTASLGIHGERGNPGRITPRDSRGDCALKNEAGAILQHEQGTTTTGR